MIKDTTTTTTRRRRRRRRGGGEGKGEEILARDQSNVVQEVLADLKIRKDKNTKRQKHEKPEKFERHTGYAQEVWPNKVK